MTVQKVAPSAKAAVETAPSGPATPQAEVTDTTPDTPSTDAQTFDADYVKKLRAESAKYRTEAKAAAEKARQFDEITESQKSELQKAQERAEAAERQLQDAQVEALRAKIASAKGIPAYIADRLKGSTQEEMEADADAMLEELNKRFVAKQGTPREATGAGVAGKSTDYEAMSPADLANAIRNRGK